MGTNTPQCVIIQIITLITPGNIRPKHGSWLNIIEGFFAKMTKTFLRGVRVASKSELKQRIYKWLEEINETPVIFRWKYGLDSISLA